MRSEQFHSGKEKSAKLAVKECSRLSVHSTEPVHVYQLDDQGKRIKLLHTFPANTKGKIKLNMVDDIEMDSKGDYQSILEGPEPMDMTSMVESVERPMTQAQLLRAYFQNADNVRALRAAVQADSEIELTFDDVMDLGDMEDGDRFFAENGMPKTRYEMQAMELEAAKEQHTEKMKQAQIERAKMDKAKQQEAFDKLAREAGYVKPDPKVDTGKNDKGTADPTADTGNG